MTIIDGECMDMKKELYRQNNPVVNDAFDRLAVNIHLKKQQEGLKTFLFCGCEPGVGTTTIAIDLAISMSTAGWKTLLVDGDMRKTSDYKHLNNNADVGLYEYLDKKIDETLIYYDTNYDNLTFVPNGQCKGGQVNYLCSEKMQKLVKTWKEEYDYVIIDVPACASAVDGSILAGQVDGVVMVASLNYSSRKGIHQAKTALEKAGANILGIVANRVSRKEYKKHVSNYDYFTKKKYQSVEPR